MKFLYVFGIQLNGLEFVTYIVCPTSILLIILFYIYSNYDYIKISFDFNIYFLDEQNIDFKKKYDNLKKSLKDQEKFNEEV